MKLILKNFRCYAEKEIIFCDEQETGLVLLSGPSGSGKTTLLLAINFALYGTGTKLISYGKTSCSVELMFGPLTITRTKRPNRVVVKDSKTQQRYEDDAAQAVINSRFGDSFDIVSYLQQNTAKSFILMSPSEKLQFLEKFAFQHTDVAKIKKSCRKLITEKNEELLSVTSQSKLATEHLESLRKPKKVQHPAPEHRHNHEFFDSQVRLLKTTKNELDRLHKDLETLKNSQSLFEQAELKYTYQQKQITSLNEKIKSLLQQEKRTIKLCIDPDELSEIKTHLLFIEKNREHTAEEKKYQENKKQYDSLKKSELNDIQIEIEEILKDLWKENSKEDVDQIIADQSQLLNDLIKIENLNEQLKIHQKDVSKKYQSCSFEQISEILKKLEKDIQKKTEEIFHVETQSKTYLCPACCTELLMGKNDELIQKETESQRKKSVLQEELKKIHNEKELLNTEYETVLRSLNAFSKIEDLKEKISEIQETRFFREICGQHEFEKIPTSSEAKYSIDYYVSYQKTQHSQEKRLKELQQHDSSAVILALEKNLDKQRQKLDAEKRELKKNGKPLKNEDILRTQTGNDILKNCSEEELRDMLNRHNQNQHTLKELRKQLTEYEEERDAIETCEEPDSQEYEELKTQISGLIKKEKNLMKKIEDISQLVDELEKYRVYKDEFDRYDSWERKVQDLAEQEQELKKSYAAVLMLKEKILEAESIAISNIINTINVGAQEYLDLFFPVDPICARLCTFKEAKKGTAKPQINLQIEYKGMEADVFMLSGGEQSRVILAYALALGELFSSPIVLLDECTSALDQDLTSVVIDGIRKNFGKKIVIIIAHQVVTGIFDTSIKL